MNHLNKIKTSFFSGSKIIRTSSLAFIAAAFIVSGFFAPTANAIVSSIDLTSPNGTEIWSGTHDITWTAVGDPGDTVAILLSNNDFTTSATLIAAIAHDAGFFPWDTTTVADGTNYKIKVQSPLGVFDASAAPFEVDNTAPVISSVTFSPGSGTANINDVVTVTIDADETGYTNGGITVNGIPATGFTDNLNTTYTVTYTVLSGHTDRAAGTVPVSVVLTDDADLPNSNAPFTTPVVNTLAIDANVPTLTSTHIQSDNLNNQYAKTGDTITLTFTSSEAVSTPIVTIAGNAAVVVGGPTSWTATYTTTGVEAKGLIPFTIDFSDTAGNSGTQVIATSDVSSVTFDITAPLAPTVALLAPINSVNQTVATVSGNVPGETAGTVSVSVDDTNGVTPAVMGLGPIDGSGNYSATLNLSSLDDGTLTATVAATDLAGNTGPDGTDTAMKETTIPTVLSITTKDDDEDGSVDTATIMFSEAVDDSTFLAGNFTIGGTPGTSIVTGAPNDITFDVLLAAGVAGTEAKDVIYTPGSGVDLFDNPLGAVLTVTITEDDEAGPIMLSAITTSIITIEVTFSEDLNGSTVTNADFTVGGNALTTPDAAETTPTSGIVLLNLLTPMGTADTPLVSLVGTVTDTPSAGSNPSPAGQSVTAVDGVAPVLSSVTITSNNANPVYAKAGDTITLTFTASETIDTPTATIQGFAATSIINTVGNTWTASRVMTGTDTEGTVTFSITFQDTVLVPNVGIPVSATTDGSSVLFDRTAPSVDAGTDKEVNATVTQDATVSDPAPASGVNTYVWTKESGPGTITFSNESGIGTGVDTDISASTDGTYTLRLTVTDNAGNSAFEEMTLIWDTVAPLMVLSVPANGAMNIPTADDDFSIIFNEDIVLNDASKVHLVNDATGVSHLNSVEVQGGDGNSATLLLSYVDLDAGTLYRVNLQPGAVRDVAGNVDMVDNQILHFTTAADLIAPTFVSHTPADDAIDVPIEIVPLILFSEPLKSTTVNSTNIQLKKFIGDSIVPAIVSLVEGGTQVQIDPTSPLENNTQYYFAVSADVQDEAGNPLANPFGTGEKNDHEFTTVELEPIVITDIDNPTSGTANNTFLGGWHYVFEVTVNNLNETDLSMEFADWVNTVVATATVPVFDNTRLLLNEEGGPFLPSEEVVEDGFSLGNDFDDQKLGGVPTPVDISEVDLNPGLFGRQIELHVFVRIPEDTLPGFYTTTFGIEAVEPE